MEITNRLSPPISRLEFPGDRQGLHRQEASGHTFTISSLPLSSSLPQLLKLVAAAFVIWHRLAMHTHVDVCLYNVASSRAFMWADTIRLTAPGDWPPSRTLRHTAAFNPPLTSIGDGTRDLYRLGQHYTSEPASSPHEESLGRGSTAEPCPQPLTEGF